MKQNQTIMKHVNSTIEYESDPECRWKRDLTEMIEVLL